MPAWASTLKFWLALFVAVGVFVLILVGRMPLEIGLCLIALAVAIVIPPA